MLSSDRKSKKCWSTIVVMKSWITIIVVISKAALSSSFAPDLPTKSMFRGIQLFQSSIALQEDFFRHSDSLCRNQCGYNNLSFNIKLKEVHEPDVNNNVYSPTSNSATEANKLQVEEQIITLQSKSLKELKLACSRRSIQYGKFSEKEEYINAIWQDMEKALAFSVTGLVQPGALTELTEDQLEEELSGKDTLIVVDAFATWCGPCRVIVPHLEIAAKKLVEDEVRVVKIDVDKHQSWAARHEVEGLPAILLIQGGRVLDRLEGTYAANEIFDFVQQHIKKA